jgi:hypothetical protein
MWAYLALDTTATIGAIDPVIDATVSTKIASTIFGISTNDVVRVSVDSAEYRVKANNTWTSWTGTQGYYKNVDSAQVRHISSGTGETETTQNIYVSNDTKEFSITTEAGGGGGGFTPADLSPDFWVSYDRGVTKSGSNTLRSWIDNGNAFYSDSTDGKIIWTDSCLFFNDAETGAYLEMADNSDNPFDFGTDDISFEAWSYMNGNTRGIIVGNNNASPDSRFAVQIGGGIFTALISSALSQQASSIDSNGQGSYTGMAWNPGFWHHQVITYDRNVGVDIYEDNVLVYKEHSTEWTNESGTSMSNAGAKRIGNVEKDMWLATVRVYRGKVLTPAEIEDLHDYGIANGHK